MSLTPDAHSDLPSLWTDQDIPPCPLIVLTIYACDNLASCSDVVLTVYSPIITMYHSYSHAIRIIVLFCSIAEEFE